MLRLSLVLGAVLVVFLGGFGLWLIDSTRRRFEHSATEEARRVATTIDGVINHLMLRNKWDEVDGVVEAAAAQSDIGLVRLVNHRGKIRASSDPADAGRILDREADACAACHRGGSPTAQLPESRSQRIFTSGDGTRVLAMAVPVVNQAACSESGCHAAASEEPILGVLEVQRSLEHADQESRSMRDAILWVFLLAVLAMALLSVVLLRRLVHRPIRRLIDGATRLGAGDLSHRIPAESGDELGQLAGAFNTMAQQLGETRVRADEIAAKKLEQQVVEARREAEEKKKALEELDRKLEVIEQQRAAIRDLSLPILQIWDGVLALPIIGVVDSRRSAELMERLLAEINHRQPQFMILDITGVEVVDTQTAAHFLRMVRACQLLGTRCLVTGMRPAVVQTLVELGADLGSLWTLTTLRDGLRACMRNLDRDTVLPAGLWRDGPAHPGDDPAAAARRPEPPVP